MYRVSGHRTDGKKAKSLTFGPRRSRGDSRGDEHGEFTHYSGGPTDTSHYGSRRESRRVLQRLVGPFFEEMDRAADALWRRSGPRIAVPLMSLQTICLLH